MNYRQTVVIARLDPAIHPLENTSFLIDARVKPAYDEKNGTR
jgi:hypothetical protein